MIKQQIEIMVLEELKQWQNKTYPPSFEISASDERIDTFIDQRFDADNIKD